MKYSATMCIGIAVLLSACGGGSSSESATTNGTGTITEQSGDTPVNNWRVKATNFYSAGNLSFYTTYTYPSATSITPSTSEMWMVTAAGDVLYNKSEYMYNSDGLLDTLTLTTLSSYITTITYEYLKGVPVIQTTKDANGVMIGKQERTYNDAGQVVSDTVYDYNAQVTTWIEHRYDVQGERTLLIWYCSPGADARWKTADDVIDYYVTHYATAWQLVDEEWKDGGDNVIDSHDETMQGYTITTLDATGNITNSKRFTGPGPDGIWKTADDELQMEWLYEPA